jgi:hypothetical protein
VSRARWVEVAEEEKTWPQKSRKGTKIGNALRLSVLGASHRWSSQRWHPSLFTALCLFAIFVAEYFPYPQTIALPLTDE